MVLVLQAGKNREAQALERMRQGHEQNTMEKQVPPPLKHVHQQASASCKGYTQASKQAPEHGSVGSADRLIPFLQVQGRI